VVARKDVHVDVRHLLKRRLTVGKKQVHALAAQTGSAQRAGHPVSDAVDLETEVLIELVQEHRMMPGHHQDMTGVDWLVVHECNDLVILIDHAPLQLATDEAAERATVIDLDRHNHSLSAQYWSLLGGSAIPLVGSAYGQAVRAADDALRRRLSAEKEELAQR